ncbi:MAG TPA: carotenoid biosynthesis protein [Draconibacterium sp.]|nr:carotenoid biosynthesis protein [Draconibacterium sp.]
MSAFADIKNFLDLNFSKTAVFFVIFYLVGIAGIVIPFSFPLFVKLIPYALILSSVALVFYHKSFDTKTIIVFISIYLTGFFVEVTGVNTGLIFGQYYYGESLGLKVFNTPLIIGLNWLLLVYLTASVLESSNTAVPVKIVISALLMLGYDLIIEQIAPLLNMWNWQSNLIPVKNYLSWFLLALVFHAAIQVFRIKTKNKLAPVILVCQVSFFLILLIYFKLSN